MWGKSCNIINIPGRFSLRAAGEMPAAGIVTGQRLLEWEKSYDNRIFECVDPDCGR